MQRKTKLLIILSTASLAIFMVWLIAQRPGIYEPARYLNQAEQDSLMNRLVAYIGVKPKHADYLNRHDMVHRPFYRKQAERFSFHKLLESTDGRIFFYVIRPARHPVYEKRAIGGWFIPDEANQILDVEETFATFAMKEQELKDHSDILFELLLKGEALSNATHPLLIEWPDNRCRYDRARHEWRYDVAGESDTEAGK